MTRVGGLKCEVDRLAVAELADEDDIGVFAESRFEGAGEALGVGAHFALVDERLLRLVDELDRVFHRQDVGLAVAVDVVDHGSERGALAGARGAGDEDETARLVAHACDRGRKAELFEGENLGGDLP